MTAPQDLTLTGVAYRCRQETERFWKQLPYDPFYCYCLFHAALAEPHLETSKTAWGLVHLQYHRQVTLWAKRHRLLPQVDNSPEALADLALEKMWVSFARTPDKLQQFPLTEADKCLKMLLRFLQTCVHSVIMDALESRADEPLDEVPEPTTPEPETPPGKEFWEIVYRRLQNDKEKLVVDASYVYGLKPRQIFAMYPDTFSGVKEIHRIKENVLARFRRDGGLKIMLQP